jgi:hypothetical protein
MEVFMSDLTSDCDVLAQLKEFLSSDPEAFEEFMGREDSEDMLVAMAMAELYIDEAIELEETGEARIVGAAKIAIAEFDLPELENGDEEE